MSMTMAARSHDDAPMTEPRPRRPRQTQQSRRPSPLAWFKRRLRHRPISTLGYCAFGFAAVAVLVNALAFQNALVPRGFLSDPAPKVAASAPVPPARPAELAQGPTRPQAGPATQGATPTTTAQAVAAPTAPARPQPARESAASRDPLGDLIRTGQVQPADPVPAMRPPAAIVQTASLSADNRPVLATQRALNRVGAGPVKTDGRFGEETRAALERFERERRIPVTRDLSPRTLRELAAASGMRIE